MATLILALLVTACGSTVRSDPGAETASWTELKIERGTQGTAGPLSIAVTGVRTDGPRASAAVRFSAAAGSEQREIELGRREEVLGHPVVLVEVRQGGPLSGIVASQGRDGVVIRVGPNVCGDRPVALTVRPPAGQPTRTPPFGQPMARFIAKGGEITEQLIPTLFDHKTFVEHRAISGKIEGFSLDLYPELRGLIEASASLNELETKLRSKGYAVERGCSTEK